MLDSCCIARAHTHSESRIIWDDQHGANGMGLSDEHRADTAAEAAGSRTLLKLRLAREMRTGGVGTNLTGLSRHVYSQHQEQAEVSHTH